MMKKLVLGLFIAGFLFSCQEKKETPKEETKVMGATTEKPATPPPAEFADAKYMEMGKQRQKEFQENNLDAWITQFADNAVYQWSSGDSLVGKEAILKYWKERRANAISELKFSNDIWLPIKVNQPQKGPDAPGIWLLTWYQVDATYKTGNKLTFWVHNTAHFNDKDQVDRMIQYIDRAPINAAVGKK